MIRLIQMISLLVMLSACQSFQRPTTFQVPTDMNVWHMRAKVAVTHIDVQGQKHSFSGKLLWQQHDDKHDLKILGTFGQVAATLTGDDEQTQLYTRDGQQYQGHPNRLLQQTLGWHLPLTELRYWVMAKPAPNSQMQPYYDEDGILQSIMQQGWQIEYRDYQATPVGRLPRYLFLAHTASGLQIKLVRMQWNLSP